MTQKTKLNRQQIANRLAKEFEDGWLVNLGIGIPTLCSNYEQPGKTIIYHSENGVIGYGPIQKKGEEDIHLVNAGGQYITLIPGASIVDHADSFAIIRSGRLDLTVMGAYEVAENGDFANWKTLGRKGGGIGGAKRVFLGLQHTTRDGTPRLRSTCSLPPTAKGVAKLVCTDLGLFEITTNGFLLKEIAPGYAPAEVQAMTDAQIIVSNSLKEISL